MLHILAIAWLLLPVQRPSDVVAWTVQAPAAAATPGRAVNLKVTAKIQPGWKLYAIAQPEGGPKPLAFVLPEGSQFQIVSTRIVGPKAKVLKQDENFAVDTHYYEHEAAFTIPATVAREIPDGVHTLPLEVTFQACGKELCLRPFTQKLPVKVTIRS